jgi:hypothetical protein
MSSPLLNPLAELRRSLRRIAIARGFALTVACLLALIVLAGTIDWFVHIDETTLRLVLTCGTCAIVLFVMWSCIVRPLFSKLTDLQLAQRVEHVYPEMQGRLSSSVEFTADGSVGSPELLDSVVSKATRDVEGLDVEALPDRQPLRRAVGAVVAAMVVGLLVFIAKPVEAQTALQRLAFPLRPIPWPSTTNLRIIEDNGSPLEQDDSLKAAQGESYEVLVHNTLGRLPEDARLEYRFGRRGKPRFENLQPINLESVTRGEVGRAVLSVGTETVYFRALGDDQQTRWHWLNVVAVPNLKSIEITVRPPAYTGQEPETYAAGNTAINAIVGSTVDLLAVADQPLESASLSVQGRQIDATIEGDTRTLAASFDLNADGVSSWWIDLVAANGTEDPRPTQHELRVVKDEVPSVFVQTPTFDQQVTATAVVPIKVVATDDLEVVSLTLEGEASDTTPPTQLPLELTDSDQTDIVGSTVLELPTLKLVPGDRFVLRATANDAFDGQPSHKTDAEPRTLIVVSDEAKRAELAEQYTDLLSGLKEIADSQVRVQDQVSELKIQQEQAGLRRSDLSQLKRSETDQHRITTRLFDNEDGLDKRIQSVVDQFETNRLESPAIQSQLAEVQDELDHLRTDVVPDLLSEMTNARKSAEAAITDGSNNAQATGLDTIGRLQQEIATSLSSLLTDAESWKNTVNVQSSLAEISTQQAELNRETNALSDRTLSGNAQDRKQQSADQARMARRQQRLADQLNDLLDTVGSAAKSLPEQDPARDRLKSGEEFTKESGLALQMQEASRELKNGRLGTAGDLQAKVSNDLATLASILEGPQITSEESRLDDLGEIAETLEELSRQQADVLKSIKRDDELALAQQQDVRTKTERQQRRLDRLGANQSVAALAEAGSLMGEAEELIANQDPAAAEKASQAEQAIQKALAATKAEQQTAQQQSEQLGLLNAVNELRELVVRQQVLLDKTRNVQQAIEESGRRTRRQSREILDLAKQQGLLADAVTAAAETMQSAAVLALVIESAATRMQQAEQLLRKRVTTDETTNLQRLAVRELTEAIAAVLPEDVADQAVPSESAADASAERNDEQENRLVTVQARLSLLKTLQLSINDRTEALMDSTDETAVEEMKSLATMQQRIAALAAELLEELTEDQP